jgi:G:T/U-mismatch repair DNA glycosylase
MFEEYKFQRQLRALLKRRERTVASYDANLAKARSEKQKSDKIYEIQERRDFEVTLVNDEIGVLSSKF